MVGRKAVDIIKIARCPKKARSPKEAKARKKKHGKNKNRSIPGVVC